VCGCFIDGSSCQRLVAGGFPEGNGQLVLARGGQVIGDELRTVRGLLGEALAQAAAIRR
jgi:hypothetical protein